MMKKHKNNKELFKNDFFDQYFSNECQINQGDRIIVFSNNNKELDEKKNNHDITLIDNQIENIKIKENRFKNNYFKYKKGLKKKKTRYNTNKTDVNIEDKFFIAENSRSKRKYASTSQFFQNFVKNNKFSYNPNLTNEENFEKLTKHLKIEFETNQYKILKEQLHSIHDEEEDKKSSFEKNSELENSSKISVHLDKNSFSDKSQFTSYFEDRSNFFERENFSDEFNYYQNKYNYDVFEESFSENPYIDEEYSDYEIVKNVSSVKEFFEYYMKKYHFKIIKKFQSSNFHLSNFYRLANFMQWRNLLSEKKYYFKELDYESKELYLITNFRKFKLIFEKESKLKKQFLKFCKLMNWEDLYSLFYELFMKLLNEENINGKNISEDEIKNKIEDENSLINENLINILNKDIKNLDIQISASYDENLRIKNTIKLLEDFIKFHFPEYKIDAFGSYPQGLNLKDSDIDIAVYTKHLDELKTQQNVEDKKNYKLSSPDKKILRDIQKKLIKTHFASFSNTYFINAKVPIVKTKCNKTKVNIDIR